MNASEFFTREFFDCAIVGQEPVDFTFDIGRLGVDGSGNALGLELFHDAVRFGVACHEFILILGKFAVAPVPCIRVPQMRFVHHKAMSAKLAHDFDIVIESGVL